MRVLGSVLTNGYETRINSFPTHDSVLARAVVSPVWPSAMRALLLHSCLFVVPDTRVHADAGVQRGEKVRAREDAESRGLGSGFRGVRICMTVGSFGAADGSFGMGGSRNGRGNVLALEDIEGRNNLGP